MDFFQGQLVLLGSGSAYPKGGIWVTDNEGASWFPLAENLADFVTIQTMAVMATTPPKLVAGTDSGLYIRDMPTIQRSYFPLVATGLVAGW